MINVLIVDDKPENLYLLQVILESSEYKTISAKNGAEALELLLTTIPDLIISDILMPVMDGFTLCRECKSDAVLKNIPFFFYTATYIHSKDEEYANSLGADLFIIKPQDPDVFLEIVNNYFKGVRENTIHPKEVIAKTETVILKEYNEVLIRKIEDKMFQSEKAEKELRRYAEELENEIHERKKNEIELRKSEEYNRLLFNSTPVGLALCKMDGTFVDVNPAFAKIIGRTTEETLELTFWDITPEKDFPNDTGQLKILEETGRYGMFEKNYIHKNGHLIPVVLHGLILEREGEQFILSIIEDITERKIAEDELKNSKHLFQTLAEVSPVGIFRTRPDGFTTYVNPKWSELSGLTLEEAIGDNWLDAVHPEDREKLKENWKFKTELHKPSQTEYRFLRKDGRVVWVIGNAVPEWINNEINGYIGTITDITSFKNFESELVQAKEKAEESDRLKSSFLSNMSHEIRTPMNGILGFTELLKEPKLSGEEQQEYISIIEKSGARMLNIINDIISISKIESGEYELFIKDTNVNEMDEFLLAFFKPEVVQKGLQISLVKPLPNEEFIIRTDKEKLYAILTNLIKNAVKFTMKGSIEFGHKKKGNTLEYFVKDTGVGINKEKKSMIFERFRQGSEMHSRNYEGAGLGLSISKAYVEMLGGNIWVETEEGKGSTFYFTIPCNIESEAKINYRNATSLKSIAKQTRKLKVLVTDDDEVSCMLISIAIKDFTKEILKASSGEEAVSALRNNPDIDLVLIDIKMAEMDGIEATRQIRKFNKDVIIIAQTAFALTGDREKAIEAGCNDYISKPIDVALLKRLIRKFFLTE